MHVVHTPGPPPNHGRMNLLITGCTWKSRNALSSDKIPRCNEAASREGDAMSLERMQRAVFGRRWEARSGTGAGIPHVVPIQLSRPRRESAHVVLRRNGHRVAAAVRAHDAPDVMPL